MISRVSSKRSTRSPRSSARSARSARSLRSRRSRQTITSARSRASRRSKGSARSKYSESSSVYSDGVDFGVGDGDLLEELERRLNFVRWKQMQNENTMKSMLKETKQLQELDVIAELSSNRVDEKIGWMKSIIEDELRQPLIIPEQPPTLVELEKEQRNEVVRFDKHLRTVELMADKMRVGNPDAVDAAFGKKKGELLRDCGMEVLRTERSDPNEGTFRSDEERGVDETRLADYLAMVGTLPQYEQTYMEDGEVTYGVEEDAAVPAVTRLALLHRELTEEKKKHLRAAEELVRFQRLER
eukprot:g4348.t1